MDFSEKLNELSSVKKVIGVVSGEGGVGKSLVNSMLAVTMNRMGYHTAILDADITGPSIPKAFGIRGKAIGSELGLFPINTKDLEALGLKVSEKLEKPRLKFSSKESNRL